MLKLDTPKEKYLDFALGIQQNCDIINLTLYTASAAMYKIYSQHLKLFLMYVHIHAISEYDIN